MYYDKKIKYLDYYEKGERIKGCGFAKIEAREEELRIELAVSGLYPTDTFSREVMLCSERQEKQLAQIELFQGRGEMKRIYHSRSDVGGTGIPYWELCGICIHLGGEREISCRWQKGENKPAELLFKKAAERSLHAAAVSMAVPESWAVGEPERERTAGREASGSWAAGDAERERSAGREASGSWVAGEAERERTAGREAMEREDARREPAKSRVTGREPSGRGSAEEEAGRRAEPVRERQGKEPVQECQGKEPGQEYRGKEPGQERRAKELAREERRHPRMLDDKWLQLCAIYPHVQPFRDERDYLSIKPADFLLFPANAYRQVNNSFLLHGYYNYKHLLLSRVERKGEILYYVGVPGNYYDKEKQVALMFGFESFECAEEPAENGDFGYYMMRMEL